MRQLFLTKSDKSLLPIASGFLLQNAKFFFKMRQLLQNATILSQNALV